MRRLKLALGLGTAALVALTACNAIVGLNEREGFPAEAGADGGGADATVDATSDGSAEDAGGDSGDGSSDSPGDSAACSGSTFYVSPSGLDTNPGCSPSEAKHTIAAAVTAAKGLTNPTFKVCAGTYDETNLQLSAGSLLGGYDCSTWDGGPSAIDAGAPTTIIQNQSPAAQAATLTVLGSASKVEGFAIQGAASPTVDGGTSTLTYAAIAVYGPGSPTIENDTLVGGSGVGGSPASAGITIDGSSPVVNGNVIQGGAGVSTGTSGTSPPASVGVLAENNAAPTIENNVIGGGSGVSLGSTNASAGIEVQGSSGPVTITGNTVNGGSGSVTSPTASAFGSSALHMAGPGTTAYTHTVRNNVFVGGAGTVVANNSVGDAVRAVFISMGVASLVFDGNIVDAGDEVNAPGGLTSGASCGRGVEIDGSASAGTVSILGNRIYGGHCANFSPSLASSSFQFGLFTQGPFAALTIENNMIHGGVVGPLRWGAAMVLGNGTAVARHNTLVAPVNPGDFTFPLWLRTLPADDVVENNVLAGVGPLSIAFQVDTVAACQKDSGPPAVQSFQNNFIFGATDGVLRAPCSPGTIFTTLDQATAALSSSGASGTAGNVILQGSCATVDGGTGAGCVTMACAGGLDGGPAPDGGCLDTVFAGWDDGTTGYGNLFGDAGFEGGCPAGPPAVVDGLGVGWPLSASGAIPCAVARSSLNDVSGEGGVSRDLYDDCRSTTPTMGAAEMAPDASCK